MQVNLLIDTNFRHAQTLLCLEITLNLSCNLFAKVIYFELLKWPPVF